MHIILQERIKSVVRYVISQYHGMTEEISKKIEEQVIEILDNENADRTPENIINITIKVIDELFENDIIN